MMPTPCFTAGVVYSAEPSLRGKIFWLKLLKVGHYRVLPRENNLKHIKSYFGMDNAAFWGGS